MSLPPDNSIPVVFRVRPEAIEALMRLWARDTEKTERDSIRAYLGEVMLRCLNIVVTPENERSPEDRKFLAQVGKEIKDSVVVTMEDGQEVSFRFL
jgi:hypothetical protein